MVVDFAQVTWDEQLEEDCRQIVRLAVREDLDRSLDWTTASLVPREARGEAHLVTRGAGVISGLAAARLAIQEMQADLTITMIRHDGDPVAAHDRVATLSGSVRDLLTTERTLLNLIGRLSGIASLTQEFVTRTEGTAARVYDTRKTTPGWRRLEKYAVVNGGGHNHRMGLFAAVMIKDNHLAFSEQQGITPAQAVVRVRQFLREATRSDARIADMIVEVEVDTWDQFREVLVAEPDIVLLDNMSCDELAACVRYRDKEAATVQLEASGGVSLQTVQEIAATGVDRISVGALTHSAVNFDVGLDWA